ncbi:MAG: DUF2459 domain-containing protein [Cryomorphaceae bacterium]|nr:DUF2459 domain-containing protein [Cryomorphaceae bacterium]
MKKAIRYLKRGGTFLGLIILSYFALCVILALIPVEKELTKAPKTVTIYFMQSGVHTDFILPVHHKIQQWDALFPYENNNVYDTTFHWIGIGMGDKRFFLTTPTFNDLTFSTAFRGAFGLSGAAIHANYHYEIPHDRPVIRLKITENQYNRLCRYIKQTLRFNKGKPILLESKVEGTTFDYDRYYDAKGTYSVVNTCNSWINEGLKVGGQRGCYWTAFAGGIFFQYGK